jgi:hypothetical protein
VGASRRSLSGLFLGPPAKARTRAERAPAAAAEAAPGEARRLDPDRARFGSRLPWLPWLRATTVSGEPHPCAATRRWLAAGCGRPARTPFVLLVRALPVVAWTMCDSSCLSPAGPRICWLGGGTRDIPVEALFPEGRERFELGSSGWSRIAGIDAIGGPPHRDFTDKCGARVGSLWCPARLGVTLVGVFLDLVREVGDKLGSLCQVVAPDGMGMQR